PLWRTLLAATVPSDKSYLAYMAARLLEMRRLLKPTGSIYLHCDPTMSHYLKLVMDAIFGRGSYVNEVIWRRTGSHNRAKRWGPIHDTLLYYAKSEQRIWNRIEQPYEADYIEKTFNRSDEFGRYFSVILTGPGVRNGDSGQPWRGIDPTESGRHWELPPDRSLPAHFNRPEHYSSMTVQERLDVLDSAGLVYWPPRGSKPGYKRYLSATNGRPIQDIIGDIRPLSAQARERTGYPTQKPLALLDRIIRASSNEGDSILDPFCGCATACVASELSGREWVGIDISEKAAQLVQERLQLPPPLGIGPLFHNRLVSHRQDTPFRTDLGIIPPYNCTANRNALYGAQGGNCAGCETHFLPQHLTVDHIIAKSKGGTDHLENLQLLCSHCNSVKGDRGMEYLKTKLQLAA
ncbi:MAG: DNA methyltransferase, partial [Chloroflexota bacterium]|nr:DNA methyltransferase [Chloroflexota bacterium]